MSAFSVMVGESLKKALCPKIYKPITLKKHRSVFTKDKSRMAKATSQNRFIFFFFFLTYHTLPFFLFLSSGTSSFERAPSPESSLRSLSAAMCVRSFFFFTSLWVKEEKKNDAPSKQRNMYKEQNNRPPPFGPRTRPDANSCEHHLAMIPQKLTNPVAVSYHAVLLSC